MFTLALGVATLMVLENLLQRSIILGFLWTLGMARLASWLGVDYEGRGILIIVIFYLFHYNTTNILLNINHYCRIIFCFIIMAYFGIIGTILAISIIYLYNEYRSFINKTICKYVFYSFYFIHLLITAVIKYFTQNIF